VKVINPRLAARARRLDPLWRLLAPLLRALGRLPDGRALTAPRSILVVDLHLLGDIVLLVPLLRVLRRGHPDARITLLAGPWSRDILAGSGLVDEHIDLAAPWVRRAPGLAGWRDLARALGRLRAGARGAGWDWGIDVRGDLRNIGLLVAARARRRVGFDFTGGAALLTDVVPDDGRIRHIVDHHAAIAAQLGLHMSDAERVPVLPRPAPPPRLPAGAHRVGFHFGASMPLRRLPAAEAARLVQAVLRPGETPVLVDAPDTRALNDELAARLAPPAAAALQRWEGGLRELMGLLSYLDRFYGLDSGPAHLAAALGTPTTVLFGPSLSVEAGPLGAHVQVLERQDLSCRPCDRVHCTNPSYQACLTNLIPLPWPTPRDPARPPNPPPSEAPEA
jgi:ADP-heptose:LPS heptosyltransferase